MRAWAKGLLCLEAAVELLIGHQSWLFRGDFLAVAVEPGREVFSGREMAVVDFGAAATLGSVSDLLRASVLVSGLSARAAEGREQAARKSPCKEDNRAACAAQSDAGSAPGATPGPDGPASRAAGRSGDAAAGLPDCQSSRRNGSCSRDGG